MSYNKKQDFGSLFGKMLFCVDVIRQLIMAEAQVQNRVVSVTLLVYNSSIKKKIIFRNIHIRQLIMQLIVFSSSNGNGSQRSQTGSTFACLRVSFLN